MKEWTKPEVIELDVEMTMSGILHDTEERLNWVINSTHAPHENVLPCGSCRS